MKHKFFNSLLILGSVLVLAQSCNNQSLDVSKLVTVTVRPSTIFEGITPYDSQHIALDSDASLRISVYLYDGSDCVSTKTAFLSSYSETATMSVEVEEGKSYSVLAFASCVVGTSSTPDLEAFTFTQTDYSSTFKIEQNYFRSFYSSWSSLGYAKANINSSSSNVSLNLQPVTAYVIFKCTNFQAEGTSVDTYRINSTNNSIVRYNGSSLTYSSSLASSEWWYTPFEKDDYKSTAVNVYELLYMLPSTATFWGSSRLGNAETQYKTSGKTLTIKAGHQYVVSFDCSTHTLTAVEGTL